MEKKLREKPDHREQAHSLLRSWATWSQAALQTISASTDWALTYICILLFVDFSSKHESIAVPGRVQSWRTNLGPWAGAWSLGHAPHISSMRQLRIRGGTVSGGIPSIDPVNLSDNMQVLLSCWTGEKRADPYRRVAQEWSWQDTVEDCPRPIKEAHPSYRLKTYRDILYSSSILIFSTIQILYAVARHKGQLLARKTPLQWKVDVPIHATSISGYRTEWDRLRGRRPMGKTQGVGSTTTYKHRNKDFPYTCQCLPSFITIAQAALCSIPWKHRFRGVNL